MCNLKGRYKVFDMMGVFSSLDLFEFMNYSRNGENFIEFL